MRYLALNYDFERIYLAVVNRNRVVASRSLIMETTKTTSEAIALSIGKALRSEKIRENALAITIPDSECFFKTIDATGWTKQQLEINVPAEFHEFFPVNQENDYSFQYQLAQGTEKGKMVIDVVAVLREEVKKLKLFAEDANLRLERAVPESIALGNLIEKSKYPLGSSCLIDLGLEQTVIRVYDGREMKASYTLGENVRKIADMLEGVDASLLEGRQEVRDAVYMTEECEFLSQTIGSAITVAINYYKDQGLLSENARYYVHGEGALVTPILQEIERGIDAKVLNISEMINGNIPANIACMAASAIGAAVED